LSTIERVCDGFGKEIKGYDIRYPFFDISRCGGGILYLCARCAVGRVLHFAEESKVDILERVGEAEKEKNDPFSGGLLNFYWAFPISPIHWIKFYTLNDDLEEIKQMLAQIEEEKK
jgi:hypothetical protein